ncbi:hypothetical protein OF001_U40174 [Pseudomonas sp. OF001]|nr:hypothetical protein OF001_U40174 [Pseudomonas sp. OF001]
MRLEQAQQRCFFRLSSALHRTFYRTLYRRFRRDGVCQRLPGSTSDCLKAEFKLPRGNI